MCQMRQILDVILTDPIHINETIFDLWSDDLNVNDAHTSLSSRLPVASDAFIKNIF